MIIKACNYMLLCVLHSLVSSLKENMKYKIHYRIFRPITRSGYYTQLPILAAKCIFDDGLDAPEDNAHCSPLTSYTTVPYVSLMYQIKCQRSGSFIREGIHIKRLYITVMSVKFMRIFYISNYGRRILGNFKDLIPQKAD